MPGEHHGSDLYGFALTVTQHQSQVRERCDAAADKQVAAWVPYVERDKLPPEAKLKEMVRKGVPPTLRTWVWMETCGASRRRASQPSSSYYSNMAAAGERSPFLKDIDQDVVHTFPAHPWLHQAEGQAALRRVLSAYSMHNECVGYCRSLNHIAALLLVALNRNEEAVFWLLAALVEDVLYPGTYGANLSGCQVEMRALEELVGQKLPRLAAHLAAIEVDVSVFALDWFLTLFATSLPSDTVARVWDALFCEGPKVVFRVALALLQLHEGALLRCDNAGDAVLAVRAGAAAAHDRDALMAVAFEGIGSLSMAVIDKYRADSTKEVEAAIAERTALKRRQDLRDGIGQAQAAQHAAAEGEDDSGLRAAQEQLQELGRSAGVLGKQAASNLRKSFGSLVVAAKDLSSKTAEAIKARGGGGGGGSGGDTGSDGGSSVRVAGAAGVPAAGLPAAAAACDGRAPQQAAAPSVRRHGAAAAAAEAQHVKKAAGVIGVGDGEEESIL